MKNLIKALKAGETVQPQSILDTLQNAIETQEATDAALQEKNTIINDLTNRLAAEVARGDAFRLSLSDATKKLDQLKAIETTTREKIIGKLTLIHADNTATLKDKTDAVASTPVNMLAALERTTNQEFDTWKAAQHSEPQHDATQSYHEYKTN